MKTMTCFNFARAALVGGFLLVSLTAQATLISEPMLYTVKNFNDGKGKHSLWTNKDYGQDNTFSATELYLSVDSMGTSDISDDTAHLFGTATATGFAPGLVAEIDLLFSGAMPNLDFSQHHYKQENGLSYNDLLLNSPVFWESVLGSIEIGDKVYDVDQNVHMSDGKGYTLQFGYGANAKNQYELGGSSWIQTCQRDAGVAGADDCMGSHHWDLNFSVEQASVPEPGTVALLLAGLLGLVTARRRSDD